MVYATGDEHPLRGPCQRLVAAIADGVLETTTTAEVIQEFAHVRARRLGRSEAVRIAHDFRSLLRPLLVIDETMLSDGLRIYEDTPHIGSFDAVLAAAAITISADALVSADRGFGTVKGLTRLDPADPDFLERIGIA